jgi:hypothetical protein
MPRKPSEPGPGPDLPLIGLERFDNVEELDDER